VITIIEREVVIIIANFIFGFGRKPYLESFVFPTHHVANLYLSLITYIKIVAFGVVMP
jgi:hypothetical protein